MNEPPKGQLFSELYVSSAPELADSSEFRLRITSFITSEILRKAKYSENIGFANYLAQEIGYYVYRNPSANPDYWSYFKELPINRLLNSITIISRYIGTGIFDSFEKGYMKKYWISFVSRVFSEENLRYTIDNEGGVHLKFDQEFEINRHSAIKALSSVPFSAARKELEDAFEFLSSIPEYKVAAIRSSFSAVETLVKVMFPEKISRLEPNVMDKFVRPLVQEKYLEPGRTAAFRMLESAKGWITACHQYRHGAEIVEPVEPPLELAVHMVGTAAAVARWVVDLNAEH